MGNENIELKRYLIGGLSSTESEQVDLRVISGEISDHEMAIAESELIEDYLEGSLSDEETKLFQDNFLVSAERRQMVDETALLMNYASSGRAVVTVSEETGKRWSFFNLRPLTAAFALIVIGLATFTIWSVAVRDTMTPLETEYAALNKKDLNDLSGQQNYSNVQLEFGVMRDNNAGVRLNRETLSEQIFFRLGLPFEPNGGSVLDSEVLKDGKRLFRVNNNSIYRDVSSSELRLLLPKTLFAKGEYQIKVTADGKDDTAVVYNFTIE